MNYYDPKVLAGIKNLFLRARFVVDGAMMGIHSSRAKGMSAEFEEHRGYTHGDDPRHIDWKAYAKFDRYFIKEYRETTNLRAFIVMDCSASMNYASDGMSKFVYGSTLAASLAYLMLRQQESVGLITFSDKIEKILAPKSAHDHLFAVLKTLQDTVPRGKTSAAAALQDLAAALKKRGMVILISDLLDAPQRVAKGLRQIRARGSEVIVFHLLDPAELNFPFKEPSLFEDLEEEVTLLADPRTIRPAYLETLRQLTAEYRRICFSNQIDYTLFETSTGLDRALTRYLTWRQKFRAR
ncbi:MAG: DUF58 domain-containing protein [Thermodesulfobacteriota bacterium]